MTTVRVYGGKSRGTASAGSPLLAGLLVGIVLVVAWVLLVYVVHRSVGVAAWGVGALLGVVVAKSARPPSRATGTLAAILTVGTVLLAKAAVVVFALQPILRDEIARNHEAIAGLYLIEMIRDNSFSAELQAEITAHPALARDTTFFGPGVELRERMVSEAEARARAASRAERERLVHAHLDSFIAQLGFWVLLLATFGVLDLLWIGLGVSTAWKLGQGIG